MNSILRFVSSLFLAALCAAPLTWAQTTTTTTASTGPVGATSAGVREFTLGAAGVSDRRFSGSTGGVSGSFGWFLNDMSEVVLRQSINFSTGGQSLITAPPTAGGAATTGSTLVQQNGRRQWDAGTRLAFDQHFGMNSPFRPFIGANIGGVYGRSIRDTWAAGLEAGGKYYVQPRTFLVLLVEYDWNFKHGRELDNRFSDGQFNWSAGVGFNF